MAYKYPYEDEQVPVYVPRKLKTDRRMWKLMLFLLPTLGIYAIIFFISFSFDLDKIHRSKSMNYIFAHFLALFTFNIVIDIWHYQTAKRVEEALEEYKIDFSFGTSDFWAWFVVGSLILVGPFIYFHKLCKAMNLLCERYNETLTIPENS